MRWKEHVGLSGDGFEQRSGGDAFGGGEGFSDCVAIAANVGRLHAQPAEVSILHVKLLCPQGAFGKGLMILKKLLKSFKKLPANFEIKNDYF